MFTSARARRQTLALLVVLVVALVGASGLLPRYVPWITDPEAIREAIRSFGPFAPAAFVLVQATQVVVAPIPGHVLGFVGGYLFGTVLGTAYSLFGAAIGSYVVFRLSRRYGRSYVERVVNPDLIEGFDDLARRRGLLVLFVLFLVPGLPDDAVCFVAGLTTLRIREMLVVSVVGRVPGYLLVNAAGAQLAAGRLTATVVLVTVLVILSVVGYLYRDEVIRRFGESSA